MELDFHGMTWDEAWGTFQAGREVYQIVLNPSVGQREA